MSLQGFHTIATGNKIEVFVKMHFFQSPLDTLPCAHVSASLRTKINLRKGVQTNGSSSMSMESIS